MSPEDFALGDFGLLNLDFGLEGFSLSREEEPTKTSVYTRPVVRRPQAVSYDRAEQFARDLVIDNEHETFAFVSGNFVFGDFVEALVDLRKVSVRRMSLMTLSLNDENIDSIRNIVEWQPIERLDLVLSDYWFAHERKQGGLVDYLFDELDVEGLDLHVAFAGVHCKTWAIETLRGNTLVMEGSANLRSSGNIEQVHITPDRGVFDFVDGFTRRVIETYDVVNQEARKRRSVRRSRLWQAVAGEADQAEAMASRQAPGEGAEAPQEGAAPGGPAAAGGAAPDNAGTGAAPRRGSNGSRTSHSDVGTEGSE